MVHVSFIGYPGTALTQSDQRVFAVRLKNVGFLATHQTHSKDSDQTGHTGHCVRFVVLRLNNSVIGLISGMALRLMVRVVGVGGGCSTDVE